MPGVLEDVNRTGEPKRPAEATIRAANPLPTHNHRSTLFFVCDLVFLVLAGIAATLTMHLFHKLEWPFIPTSVIGMIAAMLVQTLIAVAAAPLLGSIESMVPSMIVAMVSPMTMCVLHLLGCESMWPIAVGVGAAFAIVMFFFVRAYARTCKGALTFVSPLNGG